MTGILAALEEVIGTAVAIGVVMGLRAWESKYVKALKLDTDTGDNEGTEL